MAIHICCTCWYSNKRFSKSFHALRRTTEGLLYYTKVNKDSGETLDFDGGSTDLSGR